MTIQDLDELPFGSSEAERISHLGVLALKHGHRLQILLEGCNVCFDSLPTNLQKYAKEIKELLGNLIQESDTMLKLTNQKKIVTFADNDIKKKKEVDQKIARAVSLFAGNKISETTLDRLIAANMKFKVNLTTQPETISKRVKRRNKKSRRRRPALISPTKPSFPYVVEGKTHITFYIKHDQIFELPRPSNKETPNLYSLKEIVVHLAVCNVKGIRNLIEYLKESNRITFTRNTVEKYLRIYKNKNELPEDVLSLPTGRQKVMKEAMTSLNDKSVDRSRNTAWDPTEVATEEIAKRLKLENGKGVAVHRTTNEIYAGAAVLADPRVRKVRRDELRIQSVSREIAAASERTCMSPIFVVVCTQFLPGEWIDRPADHLLPEGCLEFLKIAEGFYQGPVKPVQPRYIFNFDDWGRHLSAAAPSTRQITRKRGSSTQSNK
jgi:hypothetical protein